MVETISNVLVMEVGWTDVGSGGYILVSCAHSNTSYVCHRPVSCVSNIASFSGLSILDCPLWFSQTFIEITHKCIQRVIARISQIFEWAIKKGQSRETGNIGYTRR